MEPVINEKQLLADLDRLGEIGRREDGGYYRLAFSEDDMAGRDLVDGMMRDAGLEVSRDEALNSVGRYPGTNPEAKPIMLGSHTDSVPCGGNFDGALGVLTAIAAVRALNEAGIRLDHPVEVVNFSGEEATIPGGTFGSRVMTDHLKPELLDKPAWDGQPAREFLQAKGIDFSRLKRARRYPGDIAGYVELHVEQGGQLAKSEDRVGVVQGIVGIRRYAVSVPGFANHAGTTIMEDRDDALVKAAPLINAVRDTAVKHGIVGTIGTFEVKPGAPNVIPGRVDLTFELRGLDEAVLDTAQDEIRGRCEKIGASFELFSNKPPVTCDPRIVSALERGSMKSGHGYVLMPSGAGHDANLIAEIAPIAMIFVPSEGGVSHSCEEYTRPEDCVAGAQVLLAGLQELDIVLK
jgi:N-carbamoyl-L-amino-acid hydrolase